MILFFVLHSNLYIVNNRNINPCTADSTYISLFFAVARLARHMGEAKAECRISIALQLYNLG